MTLDEEWRPVVGYEGRYEVSSQGRARSLDALDKMGRRVQGRLLKPSTSGGYPLINLTGRDGVRRSKRVHVLVAEAFLGPKPAGRYIEVCHNDNDPSNPRASNLRWDTRRENAGQCVDDGRNPKRNRTACPNGHDYTPENTYWHRSSRSGRQIRQCLTCKRKQGRETSRRRRAR